MLRNATARRPSRALTPSVLRLMRLRCRNPHEGCFFFGGVFLSIGAASEPEHLAICLTLCISTMPAVCVGGGAKNRKSVTSLGHGSHSPAGPYWGGTPGGGLTNDGRAPVTARFCSPSDSESPSMTFRQCGILEAQAGAVECGFVAIWIADRATRLVRSLDFHQDRTREKVHFSR